MKTLVRLGGRASFELSDGRIRKTPGSILYDATGVAWPKCSLLVMSFEREGRSAEPRKFMRDWMGEHETLEGRLPAIPPRDLREWTEVGRATWIFFTRSGEEEGDYKHPFDGTGGTILSKMIGGSLPEDEMPVLYVRGNAHRCELGAGCVLDGGGLRFP